MSSSVSLPRLSKIAHQAGFASRRWNRPRSKRSCCRSGSRSDAASAARSAAASASSSASSPPRPGAGVGQGPSGRIATSQSRSFSVETQSIRL